MGIHDLTRVAVVGAGTMGAKIAAWCAAWGKQVTLYDVSDPALLSGLERGRDWLAHAVSGSQITQAQADGALGTLGTLRTCSVLSEALRDAELVIEVVPERLELKQRVWQDLDRLAPPSAILATSSSAIPVSRIAVGVSRPDRVLNVHFPHPRADVPVEIMPGPGVSEAITQSVEQFVGSLRMIPIRVRREIMGFGLNTTWHEIKRSVLHLVDDGALDFEDIDRWWMTGFGPLPLFAHMDMVGLDIVRDIEQMYFLETGDERERPPKLLDRMIAAGRLGVKTGRGFYTYPNPEYERPGWLRKEPPWTPDMTVRLDEESIRGRQD